MSRVFVPDTVEIVHKDKPLMQVRGLNLTDCVAILRRYHVQAAAIFKMIDTGGTREQMLRVISQPDFYMTLFAEFPDMAAYVVHCACDKEYPIEEVAKFPVNVYFEALTAIVKLTLEDFGGPKALAALLRKLYQTKS